jgi:cytochrome c553
MLVLSTGVAVADSELQAALRLMPDPVRGAEVYALCSNCHREDGHGHADGTFPAIAGQHRKVILKQLADIRARDRDNPTMYPFSDPAVIGGSQAVADVAAYIATLPANPSPGTGPGVELESAKKLYTDHCAGCHGHRGEGNNDAFFPRISGQHYAYLQTQLTWIRDGRRRNANWAMVAQLKSFTDQEISAVADYVSRLSQE